MELDPLSQLIGGLSAQIQGLSSQVIDLRSEVVTNRNNSQTRFEELSRQIELVHAEYRNIKHLERGLEQDKIAVDTLLTSIRNRLDEIERVILIWKTRAGVIMTIAIMFGSILSMIVKPLFEAVWTRITG